MFGFGSDSMDEDEIEDLVQEEISEKMSNVGDDDEDLQKRIKSLSNEVDDIKSQLNNLGSEKDVIEDDLEEVNSRVDDLDERTKSLSEIYQDYEEATSPLLGSPDRETNTDHEEEVEKEVVEQDKEGDEEENQVLESDNTDRTETSNKLQYTVYSSTGKLATIEDREDIKDICVLAHKYGRCEEKELINDFYTEGMISESVRSDLHRGIDEFQFDGVYYSESGDSVLYEQIIAQLNYCADDYINRKNTEEYVHNVRAILIQCLHNLDRSATIHELHTESKRYIDDGVRLKIIYNVLDSMGNIVNVNQDFEDFHSGVKVDISGTQEANTIVNINQRTDLF